MNVPTIPGQVYVVTSSADCTVTCDINGITYTLCTASAGQATFCAPSDTVTLSDSTAIVTPTFKGAARAALASGCGNNNAGQGLPTGYTALEYLETDAVSVDEARAYFLLPLNYDYTTDMVVTETEHDLYEKEFTQAEGSNDGAQYQFLSVDTARAMRIGRSKTSRDLGSLLYPTGFALLRTVSTPYDFAVWSPGYQCITCIVAADTSYKIGVFCAFSATDNFRTYPFTGRKKSFRVSLNNATVYNLIPALDETGAPCMFDLVGRKPYYSEGPEDFTYPTVSGTRTYALRRMRPVAEYAKLTPRGIKRLYKLPANYSGSPEQYIAGNGYKRLVETSRPVEGYWVPEWHETETELVLDWREVEPPEELENEPEILTDPTQQ